MDANKIDLGCGENKYDDEALGVDIVSTEEVDIVQNLNETPWDLPSNQFDDIYCRDIIEHVEDPLKFLEEVYRISKSSAYVYIKTPHFTSNNAWVDPTHKRPFSVYTFSDYITVDGKYSYYTECEFTVSNIKIGFARNKKIPWNILGEKIANKYTWFYENTFVRNIFPARSIEVELKAIK
ncbi:methyltransferase domain-containing protein [Halorubrum ezzemoulense]|uniref:methyltransferase domain-containing protein n=1 Tax=Halorubrum ezzemoulense TaxID=337243 RepID=UPI00232E1407|nr:methyltransferase domain-containing protein [Halorubrum ezzemoulense]MDB2262449.1 methyltransferase domain-containing protein [Halorubrum ezzemoulense]MDB2269234.1 methyltransferase domain-containing protein [Halorubrum ezzemoulense]